MTAAASSWYIPGEGKKPAGPFTTDQIIESWRAGRINDKTPCWREGMTVWLPLAMVEPFASTMRSNAAEPRDGGFRRLAARLCIFVFMLAILTVAVGGFYVFWQERNTIAGIKTLIAAEDNEGAMDAARPFRGETYFFGDEARYLYALAAARQYASAAEDENLDEDALRKYKKQLQTLLQTSENWRTRAKSDFADAVSLVPIISDDGLDRCREIAVFLEDLKLVERKQLAKELLGKVKDIWTDPQCGPKQSHGEIVAWIAEGNAPLMDEIVASIISDTSGVETNLDQKLACIQHWSRSEPKLASSFAKSLAKHVDELVITATVNTCRRLIAAAKRIDPQFDTWRYWKKHYRKSAADNTRDVVAILSFMVKDEDNKSRLKEAVGLFLDLQRQHPNIHLTPPPEIKDVVKATWFSELIANAALLLERKHYRDALAKLNDARSHYATLWDNSDKANELHEEVRFHIAFTAARELLEALDLGSAEERINQAILIRPENKEARDLQAEIDRLLNEDTIKQLLAAARKARAGDDLDGAAKKVLAAKSLGKKTPLQKELQSLLDRFTEDLISDLCERARPLYRESKKQYVEALDIIEIALALQPNDPNLNAIKAEIRGYMNNPATTNLSGVWKTFGGVAFTLTDTGDRVECEMTSSPTERHIKSCEVNMKREKDKITANLRIVFFVGDEREASAKAEFTATILNTRTLLIVWKTRDWIDGVERHGKSCRWKRQE